MRCRRRNVEKGNEGELAALDSPTLFSLHHSVFIGPVRNINTAVGQNMGGVQIGAHRGVLIPHLNTDGSEQMLGTRITSALKDRRQPSSVFTTVSS